MKKYYTPEMIKVPYNNVINVHRQRDAYSCGPRALQTALEYCGLSVKYRELKKLCDTNEEGTKVEKLEEVVRRFGLKTISMEGDVEKLKKYLDQNCLVIILWYTGIISGQKTGHVVVAYCYDDNYIFAYDSDHNLCTVPIITIYQNKLKESWKKYKDYSWMLVLWLPEKKNGQS